MRVERVIKSPGLYFYGKWIMERTYEWRVILSKREIATLRRASEILEGVREVMDPDGMGELWHDFGLDEVACGEVYTHACADAGSWEVPDDILDKWRAAQRADSERDVSRETPTERI